MFYPNIVYLIFKHLVCIGVFLVPFHMHSANDQKNDIEKVTTEVIKAYNSKDSEKLNTFIHPSVGLYYLIRSDNVEYWLHRKTICLNTQCIKQYNLANPYAQMLLEQQLEMANDTLVLDQEQTHKLTKTIRKLRTQMNNTAPSFQQLKNIWQMERNSKRIKLVSKGDFWNTNIAFYFTYIDNNWYLSTIDFNN